MNWGNAFAARVLLKMDVRKQKIKHCMPLLMGEKKFDVSTFVPMMLVVFLINVTRPILWLEKNRGFFCVTTFSLFTTQPLRISSFKLWNDG